MILLQMLFIHPTVDGKNILKHIRILFSDTLHILVAKNQAISILSVSYYKLFGVFL